MIKDVLFQIGAAPYRDAIDVCAYRFGSSEKTLAVMGAIRGNEIQQMYTAAALVKRLGELEAQGELHDGHGIMVIPSAGQFSMNVGKRFWPLDNTDINRMFPGFDRGETTQRLAAHIFSALQGYEWGIHLTSNYLAGDCIPHVRVIHTGYQDNRKGLDFGFPYLVIRHPRPYDTTVLNYNWQIWDTNTFSILTKYTEQIDTASTDFVINGILRFMYHRGILKTPPKPSALQTIEVDEASFLNVRTHEAGLFMPEIGPWSMVKKGELIGRIIDPYTTALRETLTMPADGRIFFVRHSPLISSDTIAFRIIPS